MDLISRQDAIDLVKHRMKHNPMKSVEFIQGLQDAYLRVLNDLNSLLPAGTERKRGEWEEIEVIADSYDISGEKTWASKMECDQCGFTTIAIEGRFSQYNFCPNCGADMRGKYSDKQRSYYMAQ